MEQRHIRAARLDVRSMRSMRRRRSGARGRQHPQTQEVGIAKASCDRAHRHPSDARGR